jgi:hypothetical protein
VENLCSAAASCVAVDTEHQQREQYFYKNAAESEDKEHIN